MMRNLKVLGLAIGATLMLGATASAASAAQFHSESASTELFGEQPAAFNDKLTTDAGAVECEEVTYAGTVESATAESIELSPSYSGCTAAFGLSVTISTNGCKLRITAAALHIICPPGQVIVITAPGCTITIPPQTGINGVSFHSTTGPPPFIDVTVNANNLIYEEHKKGFFPTCANATKLTTNGQLVGTIAFKGFSGGKGVGIRWE